MILRLLCIWLVFYSLLKIISLCTEVSGQVWTDIGPHNQYKKQVPLYVSFVGFSYFVLYILLCLNGTTIFIDIYSQIKIFLFYLH
jgi:hypothetical protein